MSPVRSHGIQTLQGGQGRVQQVHGADLWELNKLEALNHEPTIAAVGGMLPSPASKDRYIVLSMRMLAQDYDELKIMLKFMQVERKLQKAKERMNTTEENAAKQEPGQ